MKYNDVYDDLSGQTYKQDLNITNLEITSLEGCPSIVDAHFRLKTPKIKSLKGAPIRVSGNFTMQGSKSIKNLEGIPEVIQGNATIVNCQLQSLKGLKTVYGNLEISMNSFMSKEGIMKQLSDYDIHVGGHVSTDHGVFYPKEEINKKKLGKFKDFLEL